jgi:hypothetical protein
VGSKKPAERILTFRITEDDYEILTDRSVEMGVSRSDYVRLLIRYARVKMTVVFQTQGD